MKRLDSVTCKTWIKTSPGSYPQLLSVMLQFGLISSFSFVPAQNLCHCNGLKTTLTIRDINHQWIEDVKLPLPFSIRPLIVCGLKPSSILHRCALKLNKGGCHRGCSFVSVIQPSYCIYKDHGQECSAHCNSVKQMQLNQNKANWEKLHSSDKPCTANRHRAVKYSHTQTANFTAVTYYIALRQRYTAEEEGDVRLDAPVSDCWTVLSSRNLC